MQPHVAGADELAKRAVEFMEIVSFEIHGTPSEDVLHMMMQIAGSGVALRIKPQPLGGYIRLKSG
jgi:hypothetical protein